MKNLILIITTLLCFGTARAQYGLSVAYQFGVPGKQGYSSDMKTSVVGGMVKLSYTYDEFLKLNLGTGMYIVPFDKLNIEGVQKTVSSVNLQIIPVTIGAEFYMLDKKFKPFIGFDIGAAFTHQDKSDYANAVSRTNVIGIPQAGVAYELTDNLNLFASIKENIIVYQFRDFSNHLEVFTLTGVNVGLSFKF